MTDFSDQGQVTNYIGVLFYTSQPPSKDALGFAGNIIVSCSAATEPAAHSVYRRSSIGYWLLASMATCQSPQGRGLYQA